MTVKSDVKAKYDLMKQILIESKNKISLKKKVELISLTSQAKILINPTKDLKNPLIELYLDLKPITLNVQQ